MPAITTQHAIPRPGWAGPKPLNLGTSRTAKVWAKRIAAYDLGMAIPKSLIGILRRTVENVYTDDAPFRSAIIMKTHYELTWNTKFGWAITPDQTAQGLRWLRRREVQKLLDESDRAIALFARDQHELMFKTTSVSATLCKLVRLGVIQKHRRNHMAFDTYSLKEKRS